MGVERQQGTVYQLSLLEWGEEAVRPGVPGEGGTGTGANEEQQGPTASERKRALPEALMEEVIEPKNLNRAYQRVKANKGAPGVDGMNVDSIPSWNAAGCSLPLNSEHLLCIGGSRPGQVHKAD